MMAGWRLFSWVAAGVFVIDQLSKLAVIYLIDLPRLGEIQVIPGFVNFRMAWNKGINFGLFPAGSDLGRWVLIALSLAICGWVVWWLRQEAHSRMVMLSGGVLVGGALGNVIDRVFFGAVADFLNVTCCGFYNPYAFNIADGAIFAGAIGLILFAGREKAT